MSRRRGPVAELIERCVTVAIALIVFVLSTARGGVSTVAAGGLLLWCVVDAVISYARAQRYRNR